ncbi:MAG: M56 family metallopeptidase [Roseivirga sp.]|nr:M56 family metallopeptidase [Roseivirga sp.]
MMVYLLKFLLCSGLLYSFYHLILRNDKLFRFNRVFLLSILLLSAIIPLVTVKTSIVEMPAAQTMETLNAQSGGQPGTSLFLASPTTDFGIEQLLVMVYIVITAFFLIKFGLNLWSLNRFKKGGEIIDHKGLKLVLRSDIQHSFSFLNHMYTNRRSFEEGKIPREILVHEEAHIQQRHSYDILFIEFLACLCWFNPIVYLTKKAIRLNHEFLADEVTISKTGALVRYQNILIHFASQQLRHNPILASHLTFGETKKRITIMVKTKNKTATTVKQITALLVILTLSISLGKTRLIAQEPAKRVITTAVPFLVIKEDPSQKQPAKVQDTKKRPEPPMLISSIPRSTSKIRYTDSNGQRITTTFGQLSDPVRKDFIDLKLDGEVWLAPTQKDHFTQAMLDDFKDAEKYGVWIDGSRVDNAVLDHHKPEDFHHFFKSKLGKGAKNFGKYTYHLNLVTQKTHDKLPSKMTGMWIKYNDQAARARRYLDPVEEKN